MMTIVSATNLVSETDLAASISTGKSLYEIDFYAWTQAQSVFLRSKNWAKVDLENVIEEIESLGRQERRALVNRLGVLIGHLLRWQFQSDGRSNSWLATIREQRIQINLLIQENPSLKSYLEQALATAYDLGVILAVKETGLPFNHFPDRSPHTFEQILAAMFLPD